MTWQKDLKKEIKKFGYEIEVFTGNPMAIKLKKENDEYFLQIEAALASLITNFSVKKTFTEEMKSMMFHKREKYEFELEMELQFLLFEMIEKIAREKELPRILIRKGYLKKIFQKEGFHLAFNKEGSLIGLKKEYIFGIEKKRDEFVSHFYTCMTEAEDKFTLFKKIQKVPNYLHTKKFYYDGFNGEMEFLYEDEVFKL